MDNLKNRLKEHLDHDIVIVGYGQTNVYRDKNRQIKRDYQNISLECETCNTVITSYDDK